MNPWQHPQHDESLASLLAAANKDMAPADREFLDRLREQSTEVFCRAVSQQTERQTRRRSVMAKAVFGLAASVAAAILIGIVWFHGFRLKSGDAVLGQVLEHSAAAQTIHVKLMRQDQTDEVWATHTGQLRWNLADGTYRIGRGEKLWLVDEKANRITAQTSPYFRIDTRPGIDLLALLDLPHREALQELRDQRPVATLVRDGSPFFVYRMDTPGPEDRLQIEVLVDAVHERLHSIAVSSEHDGEIQKVLEMVVLAYNEKVSEGEFAVSDTLTEDGRIGKLTDVQGIVTIKPVMHERWTPVRGNLLLKPGDWVRTDVRGANAVGLRLVKQTGVIVGPGSLVELIKPTQIRLHEGELEINVPEDATLELFGPGRQSIPIKGRERYRVINEKLVAMAVEPLWLRGFKGATANESIGSLIAKVDGRNVPLTVGYHKVSVDIRDQIARTVIEESFVNHTDAQLEGVFHFPLPQDASISGFGMWIGDQLIEADVVEKQRAREIYETILRERRDPGLLEWSGGNIFKARVFPIFAHSEKRIKITYTQVLPLKDNHYRYSYGLQSELLKQHPLKELAIDVKVSSVVPLKSVTSPTHSTRSDQTAHSAHVEFTAQEYTPTRDFEVVIEVDRGQSDVVVIPHRRGDDGYFMLQLTPPATAQPSPESRDLEPIRKRGQTPSDQPLGPVSHGERRGLTPFPDRLLLPDSEPLSLLILADTSGSMDAGQRSAQAALMGSLLASLTPKDRINVAACDVDCDWAFERAVPAEMKNVSAARLFLANRTSLGWTDLDRAFASALQQSGPKTHVIYVGDGIVTTGDADPVAFGQRLRRLYQGKAGIFHAVTTGNSFEPAAVKVIASLGGGSLRRITGEQGPQAVALELLNEITQPTLRDLKVEFKGLRVARVYPEQLSNVPAGSQQILLGRYRPEGRDQTGEVVVTGMQGNKPVRFSTPIRLKDAEQGNSFIPRLWARMHLDSLLEQGTSESIKDEIIALSEEYNIITPYTSFLVLETDADRVRFKVKRRFQMRDGEKFFAEGRDNANYELVQKQMKKAGNWRVGLRRTVLQQLATLGRDLRLIQPPDYAERLGRWAGDIALGDVDFKDLIDGERDESAALDSPLGVKNKAEKVAEETLALTPATTGAPEPDLPESGPVSREDLQVASQLEFAKLPAMRAGVIAESAAARSPRGEFGYFLSKSRIDRNWDRRPNQWLDTLFPHLPGSPGVATEPVSTWPAEAQTLVRSLLRTDKLAKLTGGIEIVRKMEHFDVRSNLLSFRSQALELYSRTAWLTWRYADGQPMLINWCDGIERGIFSTAFQLGRLRTSTAQDLSTPPLELSDYSLTSLERSYPGYTATLQPQGMERTLLVLRHPSNPLYEMSVLVDTARHVILNIEQRNSGRVTSTIKFDDFLEVAGCWWARRIETTDDKGRITSRISQTIKAMSADPFTRLVKRHLTGKDQVLFIHEPLPTVADAKRALTQLGRLTFDVELVLVLHFSRSQRWARVMEHIDQAERLVAGKPGVRWIRYAVLNASRRHEALKTRLLAEADETGKRHACAEEAHADQLGLAEYVIGQGAQFLQAHEMLALLKDLEPVYARQPIHKRSMKRWHQLQASYLRQAGQPEEALRVEKQSATDYPRELDVQRQYAQALVNVGDYDAAYAWLTRVLGKDSRWSPDEETALRDQYAQFLYQQGRYADLVTYLADWVKLNPEGMTVYQQYLSALIRTDQVDKANALIAQWLKDGQASGEPPPAAVARLAAAVNLALGQGHNLQTNRLEERWLAPLAEAALFFARHETQSSLADHIMGNGQFQQTDACRKVRQTAAEILTAEIGKLRFDQVQRFVNWILPDDPALETPVWKQIADGLRQRWTAETNAEIKNQLSQTLVQVLNSRFDAAEVLAFLRIQLEQGPKQHRAAYANQLFDKLIAQPWSAAYEDEAFALLDKLSDGETQRDRLLARVVGLYRLTSAMVDARFTARMKAIEHQEKLTRTELQKKKNEALRLARADFSERLQKETKASGGRQPPEASFVHWLIIERLYLETLLEHDPKAIAAECWAFLDAHPPKAQENPEWLSAEQRLDAALRDRFVITLIELATRKGAEPALIDRFLKYLDAGIAADAESDHWKLFKFQLLIALDRPKDLEPALRQWIQSDDPVSRWRISFGNLLAEQGRIAEAIKILEAVEASDELGPAAYRALADWYMVVNRREEHERAQVAVYKTMDEYTMGRWLRAKLYPWQRADRNLPTELDQEVLLVFRALFEKSSNPADYLGYLQQFYQACRDFRLLSAMADAVVGHTAGQVYPFLQRMSGVLGEVRNEATVDEIIEHLNKVRTRAKTVVDQRALDLLEVLVERRAAELKNQPGPHVEVALSALKRAFKREWSQGEQRLMADLLASLGAISQSVLAKEQLRQLEVLHREQDRGSYDRLHIADRFANALSWYSRTAEAVDLLEAALKEYQDASGGVLPQAAYGFVATMTQYLHVLRHYERGEKILFAYLQHPLHQQNKLWLTEQLYWLYHRALENGGTVSLGSGATLYQAVERKIRSDLATIDHEHRSSLVQLLCGIYRTAHEKKFPGVVEDLKAFAANDLAQVLKRQTSNYTSMVSTVAQALHDLAGVREGLAFLIARIEQEPSWFRFNNQDGWNNHAWTIGEWRTRVKDLGDLEERLLAIVTKELRRDLETRQQRNRAIYHQHHGHYWSEKADAFAQVAEEVLAKQKQSGAAAKYVAEYFYSGLGRNGRAIEVLFAAHQAKILDEGGQAQLVSYLQQQNRYAESIPLLQPLVKRRPENMDYRVQLLHAYFRTGQPAELRALLKDTDAFFHQKDRWTEGALAALAHSCLQNELYSESVAYYSELIPLHQRNQPRRGIGDGTLSDYYTNQARAYAGLKQTAEAADAACGAVVSWSPNQTQRQQALAVLREVLHHSPDLDGYVAQLDKMVAENGQDRPTVRKALGQVYLEKGKYAQAITQLQLAAELQPNDAETHQALIACYDKQGDKEGAIRQLFQSLQLSRRDIKLYEELGRRLEEIGQPKEVERAYTSIVEVLPAESESHALLAEIRQKQNRWAEAIPQWEQVARIRALEPTGLVNLTAALIHERQWDAAIETLRKLTSQAWPPRFDQLPTQIRKLQQQVEQGKK
jgi:predicted Zn-dependent protease